MCSCDLKAEPFVKSSTMVSQVYIEECLKKQVLPFICKQREKVIFWPDLASCYYSKVVLEWYATANKIHFMAKLMNPPTCSEFRPIEKFWAISKQRFRRKMEEMRWFRICFHCANADELQLEEGSRFLSNWRNVTI